MNDALPQLQQEVLDAATLEQYQTDLAYLADILEVKIRSTRAQPDRQPAGSLADAFRELREGSAGGVQLRYCFAGQHWLDTLLPVATGIRLVRVCLSDD